MKFYSTNNRNTLFDPSEAILKSLPDDNGLFMPERIPEFPQEFLKNIHGSSLQSIAKMVSGAYFCPEIPMKVIDAIVEDAVSFPVPLKRLNESTSILELFHGPTLAFKDMGARFMARLMSWMNRNETKKLTVLVATSGDTGSAVASGFFGVDGIEVVILYPSGKVSPLQEKQLTTMGGNVTSIEVKGSFDDCQRIVKTAFLDSGLNASYRLTSANSINIARLIPQSFYYLDAIRQLPEGTPAPVFVVPSGNFGNLTAGLLAHLSGMPAAGIIAATNSNDAVPRYLSGEDYLPGETISTISNAMDVGNPSNFSRLMDLFGHDRNSMQQKLHSCSFNDDETRTAMRNCYNDYGYMLDPHSAVGWLGWEKYKGFYPDNTQGIILETAHPVKFSETVEDTLGIKPQMPDAMRSFLNREKQAVLIDADYASFFEYMLQRQK